MNNQQNQNEAAGGGSALTAELEGKKQAILEIAPALLRELFCLPPAAEIVDLRVDINRRGVLELKIDGAGWLTDEGAMLDRVRHGARQKNAAESILAGRFCSCFRKNRVS